MPGVGNFDYVINSTTRYVYEMYFSRFLTPRCPAGYSLPGNPIRTTKIDHGAILKLTSMVASEFR